MVRHGQIIKHKHAMDVVFWIKGVRGPYGIHEHLQLTGDWINMGFVKPWYIGSPTKFRTTISKLKDWSIYREDWGGECLRYGHWHPIK